MGRTSVELRELDSANWKECAKLRVEKAQRDFVSSNLYAIAEAGVEGYEPYAVCDGGTIVGMVVLAKLSGETAMIHHVMVGKGFQGEGYGKSAMTEAIRLARERYGCRRLVLSYWPGNTAAELYESLGFEHTGEKWDEEPVMELRL